MIAPNIPANEEQRLDALYQANILDTSSEREFDEIVALAAEITGTPISLISLVDRDRQWFKAKRGIDGSETTRDTSFCAHAINHDGAFVVRDTHNDPRFHDNPYVLGDPHVRFYAGIPVKTQEGYPVGTLCVISDEPRDISEREERALNVLARHVTSLIDLKRSQEITYRLFSELHIRQENLQRVTDTSTRMLSVIAHDVRGPLASIVLSMDLDLPPSEQPWLLEEIQRQTRTATNLLDEILVWARTMLQGGATLQDSVDLMHILREVIRGVQKDAENKGTRLITHGAPTYMQTDPNIVRFVINTLVTNAIKFTSNGTISIALHSANGNVYITVTDSGMGMDDIVRGKLFDWKYRQSSRGTNNEVGTGMALLLVKDFLSLVNGKIEVNSVPGIGSTFMVTLPNAATAVVGTNEAVVS